MEEDVKNIENIDFLGFLTGEKLTEVMGNAKVLILPSVCYENCPLSILEAHSMNVPVITMNKGGMKELVDDLVTGTLIDENDTLNMIEKIKTTMEDKNYYNNLVANIEKEKQNILDIDAYCNILEEKYNEIINRG